MYKFDLHVHTKYSGDCRVNPQDVLRTAEERGINFVAITDHNSIKGWKKLDSNRIIPGIEISSKKGHILGLFIKENIKKGLSPKKTIRKIHEQGGLAIAPHPFQPLRNGLGRIIFDLELDGTEVFNSKSSYFNFLSSFLARNLEVPKIATSDAHFLCNIGKGLSGSKYKPKKAILENKVKILKKDRTSFRKNLKNLWFKLLKK